MSTDTIVLERSGITPFLHRYQAPARVGLKVNAYRGYEVEGLARALAAPDLADCPLECVMVGDSYFMTHLGRSSTVLADAAEREWALGTLVGLVAEVRAALDACFPAHRRPFLLADLPDGATATPAAALAAGERFRAAGADAVKVELAGDRDLECLEALALTGGTTLGHLGYTPQRGALSRHGDSVEDAQRMFARARRVRDAGAAGLIVEMVSEPVNQALSRPDPDGIPLYSVFSGRAEWGGQSLNVWDAVVRPAGRSRFFPPTAVLDAAQVPTAYTPDLIADRMAELVRLTLDGRFPLSPRTALTPEETAQVSATEPWSA
ncbi:3-methyl-2-oxobutanoate hydroxymethyltransferase [Kitasatospora sp. LaBMicrA B282]|uniref:3-methyl-2-oxobutanoate hydroxymethyltransferase n=1 Tax=Kitasatospora sp. LaBMicrA B282 TaxID=3420949 RepID=UPI003D10D78E